MMKKIIKGINDALEENLEIEMTSKLDTKT